MGWNAVKRAAGYGYTSLYWYPDGTDGWRDWDKPFEAAVPVPVEVAPAAPAGLPEGKKSIRLISADGEGFALGHVTFAAEGDMARFNIELDAPEFQEQFLSMRPFRCLPAPKEMWCHLAYPYETRGRISRNDLADLEYGLLFLFKPPEGYGIDAWNGLFFKLAIGGDGEISGGLNETDLNVLAVPPDDKSVRPIADGALTPVSPESHRFARIEIK